MEAIGTTKSRKADVLERLANGPWPTRYTWGLVGHTRRTTLAQINAYRTVESLMKAGLVEKYTDETGEENWKLRGWALDGVARVGL
ncbi:MAG: hypothetical protein EPN91_03565 [Salinibacterium sp.]|nr:MAG: hypothetical protein EPN91_03565 [Salinibacterium sp.]